MDVVSERLVTDAEAKAILESRRKEVEELKYEQKNALSVLKKFVKVDKERVDELISELKKIEKLRERQIVAIANAMPQDADDLRAVLQKEYSSLSDEEVDLILQTVRKVSGTRS